MRAPPSSGRKTGSGWVWIGEGCEQKVAEKAEVRGLVEVVPIFVLLQNAEGRVLINTNRTLTYDGIAAALGSKNAILNVSGKRGQVHFSKKDLSPFPHSASNENIDPSAEGEGSRSKTLAVSEGEDSKKH